MPRTSLVLILIGILPALLAFPRPLAQAAPAAHIPDFPPCSPVSEFMEDSRLEGSTLDFCADWNPEFVNNGHHCCSVLRTFARKRRKACDPHRRGMSFCQEMTEEQRKYSEQVATGKIDVLASIDEDLGRVGSQAFCSVNTGFLVRGRRVIPTAENRIVLRATDRCTNFGTDRMAGLIEWVGRQVAKQYAAPEYAGVRMVLGDVSAPRGGCLRHKSHTSGQDADIGFLSVRPHRPSLEAFHRDLDVKTNWWFLKQIFKNPYACVKVVFLDKRHIRKMAKVAWGDPDWKTISRYLHHVKGHRDHFHVRIGDQAGAPGCGSLTPDTESDDESDVGEGPDAGSDSGAGEGADVNETQ